MKKYLLFVVCICSSMFAFSINENPAVSDSLENILLHRLDSMGFIYDENDEVTFVFVEDLPTFPGGQKALCDFISANIHYPIIAQENGIQGNVICQFVIDKDGAVVDIMVVRSSGDIYLDLEVLRVIRLMPKWNPGKHQGKAVRVRYTLPINFKLE